jgi:plastocyanin
MTMRARLAAVRGRWRRDALRLLRPLLFSALLLGACDGTDDPPSSATLTSGSAGVTVTAKGVAFSADDIGIRAGVTVAITLDNADAVPHTLTIYAGATPEGDIVADTGEVAAGEQGEAVVLFSTPGKRAFRCEIHPTQMHGVIDVR